MPTYDYRCSECGHEFEEFQPMSSAVLTKCPNCGKESLKRAMGSGSGMIFKGKGFYLTDYKKSGNSTSEKSPEPPKKDQPKEKGPAPPSPPPEKKG